MTLYKGQIGIGEDILIPIYIYPLIKKKIVPKLKMKSARGLKTANTNNNTNNDNDRYACMA